MKEKISGNFEGKPVEGIVIKEDNKFITLKLKSGYNANIEKSKLEINKRESLIVENLEPNLNKTINQDKEHILILHTGGTIASKVDYQTGAVSSKFTPQELLGLYPELNEKIQLVPLMIANLSSEDMNFKHYNLLLEAIMKNSNEKTLGIIISHGTDTMHYSSAALQYSLENLNFPIIFVGAQRSSDRPSSDAYSNLSATVDFIIENSKNSIAYRRVGICMHSSIDRDQFFILDGINARKMHSSRRDAFKQINYSPFAKMEKGKWTILRKKLNSIKNKEKLSCVEYDANLKIGFFKAHPNLFHEEISMLKIYDGVVIDGTGLGHIAVTEFDEYTKENPKNLKALKEVMKKTKIVIGVQTVYGETNMNIYSSGRYLKETGVLGQNMNLTTETLFIRMAYLLSKDKKNFENNWEKNLEGFEVRNIDIEEE